MKLTTTKEEHMNNQTAFEWAMLRVQRQAHREGKKPNFRELLDLAHQEQEREYERAEQIAASLPDDA
jgi:hypothetical protein